jgi:hypothetical protein
MLFLLPIITCNSVNFNLTAKIEEEIATNPECFRTFLPASKRLPEYILADKSYVQKKNIDEYNQAVYSFVDTPSNIPRHAMSISEFSNSLSQKDMYFSFPEMVVHALVVMNEATEEQIGKWIMQHYPSAISSE